MISEMLKVRDGRIRRILARSSILVRNGLWSKRPGFPRLRRLQKLEDLALDLVGRTVSAHDPIFVRVDLRPVMPEPKC